MVYLIHLPVYVIIQLLFVRFLGGTALAGNPSLRALCGVLAAGGAIGLAGLSWRYFENPIMRMRDSVFPLRHRIPELSLAAKTDQTRVCA